MRLLSPLLCLALLPACVPDASPSEGADATNGHGEVTTSEVATPVSTVENLNPTPGACKLDIVVRDLGDDGVLSGPDLPLGLVGGVDPGLSSGRVAGFWVDITDTTRTCAAARLTVASGRAPARDLASVPLDAFGSAAIFVGLGDWNLVPAFDGTVVLEARAAHPTDAAKDGHARLAFGVDFVAPTVGTVAVADADGAPLTETVGDGLKLAQGGRITLSVPTGGVSAEVWLGWGESAAPGTDTPPMQTAPVEDGVATFGPFDVTSCTPMWARVRVTDAHGNTGLGGDYARGFAADRAVCDQDPAGGPYTWVVIEPLPTLYCGTTKLDAIQLRDEDGIDQGYLVDAARPHPTSCSQQQYAHPEPYRLEGAPDGVECDLQDNRLIGHFAGSPTLRVNNTLSITSSQSSEDNYDDPRVFVVWLARDLDCATSVGESWKVCSRTLGEFNGLSQEIRIQ